MGRPKRSKNKANHKAGGKQKNSGPRKRNNNCTQTNNVLTYFNLDGRLRDNTRSTENEQEQADTISQHEERAITIVQAEDEAHSIPNTKEEASANDKLIATTKLMIMSNHKMMLRIEKELH